MRKLIPLTTDTASFSNAELYLSPFLSGSPLGNINNGDLTAISHAPLYHSRGQKVCVEPRNHAKTKSRDKAESSRNEYLRATAPKIFG